MWHKEYRDYPLDTFQIQEQVRPGHGIIGCEMHEPNGWNETKEKKIPPSPYNRRKKHFKKVKKSFLARLYALFLNS